MRLENGQVGADRAFDQVLDAVETELGLALLDDGAHTGRRQHAAQAGTAATYALGQRALRHQIRMSQT